MRISVQNTVRASSTDDRLFVEYAAMGRFPLPSRQEIYNLLISEEVRDRMLAAIYIMLLENRRYHVK